MTSVLAAALVAYDAGLCPIRPRVDGTKAPMAVPFHGPVDPATGKRRPGWELYQAERPSRITVAAWFDAHPGIGLVCGVVSGHLQMLELEGRMVNDETRCRRFAEALDRRNVREVWRRMIAGYQETTPTGGMHTMVHVPGHIGGNIRLASVMTAEGPRPLIETRGDGGFVVVAPSNGTTHPTGGAWTLCSGGFDTIVTITVEEWAEVLAAAAECNEVASPEALVPAANRLTVPQPWTGGVVGPSWMDVTAAHIEATEGVEKILLRHGWSRWRETPEMVYVTRPGEDKAGGVSAQIKKVNGRLINYSTSVTEFEVWPTFRGDPPRQVPTTSYSAADVLAVYEFGGDREAALRAVAEATGIYAAWLAERDPLAGVTINPAAPVTPTHNLPGEFWERAELAGIRSWAHARMRSADAVYGAVRARLCVLVPYNLRIDTTIAVPISLNSLIAVIGSSGAGKTTSAALGRELVPIVRTDIYEGPLGSGEGVAEVFFEWREEPGEGGKTVRERVQTKSGALLLLDEGEALTRMAARSGTTILPTLRSAYSGELLGQSNARQETRRVLAAGTYRFVLLVGLQDLAAAELLADHATGTPQRFVLFNANDPAIPADAPPVERLWPLSGPWVPPRITAGQMMTLEPSVRSEVRERALAVQRGSLVLDVLDAHRDQNRLKEAAMLAILGQRLEITAEDWRLAGLVLDASDALRRWIIDRAAAAKRKAEDERTGADVRRQRAVGGALDADAHERAVIGGARAMARRAIRSAPQLVTRRELTHATAGSHRVSAGVDEMVERAEALGWLKPVGTAGWTAGGSAPT